MKLIITTQEVKHAIKEYLSMYKDIKVNTMDMEPLITGVTTPEFEGFSIEMDKYEKK